MLVLAVLLVLPLTVPAFSKRLEKHIPGFHEVKALPETMIAGSTYEWEVSLVNPKSESGLMNVTLAINEENTLIGLGEFSVEGILEAYDNPPRPHHSSTLTFIETEGGVFQSETPIGERFNHITVRISSVPNLMPGTYTLMLTVTLHKSPSQI